MMRTHHASRVVESLMVTTCQTVENFFFLSLDIPRCIRGPPTRSSDARVAWTGND